MPTSQTAQTIPVPVELLQAVVDYLAKRPFEDVHQLIPALMQCGRPQAPQQAPQPVQEPQEGAQAE